MNIRGYEFEMRKKALDVLLGLMARLGDIAPATILIGGWAPFFLTGTGCHIGSFDIDLMIDHEGVKGRTRDLLDRLAAEQFYHSYSGARFTFYRDVLRAGNEPLIVKLDLVTADFALSGQPLIFRKMRDLTLRTARSGGLSFVDPVPIRIDWLGRTVELRLVNPVAFLVLKGMVMHERERPKDFYDVVHLLTHTLTPLPDLVERIRANLHHPMIREGMRKIRSKFVDLGSPGPYGVATFLEAEGTAARKLREQALAAVDRLLVPLGITGRQEVQNHEGEIEFSGIKPLGPYAPLAFDYPDLVERLFEAGGAAA